MKEYSGVIVKSNNKCLLCKRAPDRRVLPNMWSFPSGKIENGEEPIDAAVREFFEETDIKITTNDLSFISIIYGVSGKVHLYQLKSDSEIYPDQKNAKDGNEHTECQYFKLTDLPEISKDLKKVLEILL